MQIKRSRWSHFGLRAVVSATTASFGLAASALTLAPIKVESALGQNLSAEIELTSVSADELSSLKLNTASPTVYAGMGMEFNPAIGEILLEVVSKSNGGRVIKLRSARPLTEPFIDLVLEISSPTGKLIRPYRLLLDPPRPADASAPSAPQLAARASEAPSAPTTAATPEGALSTPVSAPRPSSTLALAPASKDASPAQAAGLQEVIVKRGDTAGKIAATAKPREATLEQMLMAMLQANPGAFAQSNVNRLQVGALLSIPDTASILKINPKQARSLIHQQGLEFGLKQAQQERSEQDQTVHKKAQAVGSPGLAAPRQVDALKLSKGHKQDKAEAARLEKIAKQKNHEAEQARAAELAKNIQELNDLAKQAEPKASAAQGSASAAAAPAQAAASAVDAASVSKPAAAPPAAPPPPPAPESAELSFIDEIWNAASDLWAQFQLWILGAMALLALALGGLAWNRKRASQRTQGKPSGRNPLDIPTETMMKDSPYGGDQIDTRQVTTAAGAVAQNSAFAAELDPVAEAEVYLAYGKDVPAEEILREGLIQEPKRVAIHLKLLEIFSKRGNIHDFAIHANEVAVLAGTTGNEWETVRALGRKIDPENPLYADTVGLSMDTGLPRPTGAMTFEASKFLDASHLSANSVPPRPATQAPGAPKPPDLGTVLSSTKDSEAQAARQTAAAGPSSEIEFDFGAFSSELAANKAPDSVGAIDQLETTMELAKQFIEIGEMQSARSMLEEVMEKGSPQLRTQAKDLLAKLK